MRLAMIGLGRMGANIARRLMRGGHEVVGHDRDAPLEAGAKAGAAKVPKPNRMAGSSTGCGR